MINRVFILLFFLFSRVIAQNNLVPNFNFEQYSVCPNNPGQIYRAVPWFQPCINTSSFGTPTYYNTCATQSSGASVPGNTIGFQYPYSGNGCVFIDFYRILQFPIDSNYRNYIEVRLIDTLKANKKYCFEMYMSLADSSNFAVMNIGVLFSNDSITDTSFYKPLPYTPQITNINNIVFADTANWMLFQGIYNAQGGEQFITIGNFNNDSNTVLIPAQGTGFYGEDMAAYYIDDVSMYEMDENFPANLAGSDKTICKDSAVIIGSPAINGFKYLWSPAAGLSSDTVAQPMANPTQSTAYILQITNDSVPYSCNKPTTTDTVTVYVQQPTTVNAAGLAGEDTMLCAESNNGTTLGKPAISGYEYNWQPIQNNMAQPLVTPTQTTIYILTVTDTTTVCKTTDKDTITISVIKCDTIEPPMPIENNVFLPSIFSPNGDGINDVFRVRGENISEINFIIYNRWGEKVFETTDKAKSWDGTYKGKNLNAGVFVYFLKVIFENGTVEELKGNVTLVR